jgi:hypothetical protein
MADMKTQMIGAKKDKPYANVGERVKAFKEAYGDEGQIVTTFLVNDEEKVVSQTQVIVNGKILATGHAEEIRGSTQVNQSSALENCETSSIGRAVSFATGFMSDGSKIASTEEIQNAIVQQSQVDIHLKTMKVLTAYVSTAFKEAIANEDEQGIEECRSDMYGNQHLRAAVMDTLTGEEELYIREYMDKKAQVAKAKAEKKEAENKAYAKAYAKKNAEAK